MKSKYSRLSDQTLLKTLADLLAQDRGTTVELLACLAEVDSRKLYLPDGYPSMYAYCVHKLHMPEEVPTSASGRPAAPGAFPPSCPPWPTGGCI